MQNQLPVINLSRVDDPNQQADFYRELRQTARDIGFFYLVGHGVDIAQIRAMEREARAFFQLSAAQKNALAMEHSPQFRGYTGAKEEITRNQPDNREQIDIGAELPVWENIPDDAPWLHLQGPNLWPQEADLPQFKTTVLAYQQILREVAIKLLRAFLVALDQPENALDDLIADPPVHLLKLVRYPASSAAADAQGVGAHKDTDILTLLLQDEVGGLEVETDHGWIAVPPLQDAFVINIGEILELATNGYLRANVHRVVTPQGKQDRYSIAYFLAPHLNSRVPHLNLSTELKLLALGPEADPSNPMFHQLGANSFKSRLRSHVAVSKKYYPQSYAQILQSPCD